MRLPPPGTPLGGSLRDDSPAYLPTTTFRVTIPAPVDARR